MIQMSKWGVLALATWIARFSYFFNTCHARDLADIAAIPEETANVIISQRPYSTMDDVRTISAPVKDDAKPKGKGKGRKPPKPIGDKIVDKCIDMWIGYLAIDTLVAECEALGRPVGMEMKKWGIDLFGKREGELELTSIDPTKSHDSGIATPSSNRFSVDSDDNDQLVPAARKSRLISQPSIMADDLEMKDYQIVGINWLALLFEKELRCILADDMGLGKTCQVIAFLAHLFEIGKFCPKLSVMPYYAGLNERAEIHEQIKDNRDSINVVITTYTIAKAKTDAKFLRDMNFCHKEELNAVFANKAKTTDESHTTLLSAQRIERGKSMLKPFVLRRKKHRVIDISAKHCHVQYCEMKPSQRGIYEHEKEQVRQLLEDRAAGKKTGSKSSNILMNLRQAAFHPLLAHRHYDDTTLCKMANACLKEDKWPLSNPNIIFEELLPYNDFECHYMCLDNPGSLGKFKLKNEEWMDSGKVDQLRALLTRFIANEDLTLIFSQFTMVMDILENVLETLQIDFVRLDGRTSVEDRQSILDAFYEREDIPVFLLSTKAGGASINLACANKVVIFDSSFNPQEDVQAENRAHRVSQTRNIEIFRFVTYDTIEEQIYALRQTKLALVQAVASDDAGGAKNEEAGMEVVERMVRADLEKDSGTDKA
ncbi:hypothetical protein NUU61_001613 [Penicillium alfredii]|uniref:Helicase C-terminal domain-containing protein n=1 Tax=Penicillium alfredii TaxID=1506179 RepID=A0A9W9KLQ2_9EURO|nr:uncharacterized protein NUU61_001613 [Penicillium alfredii]KAJ5110356.1 hypothetical protein NUU61_001613 [Penicillium alfredii]